MVIKEWMVMDNALGLLGWNAGMSIGSCMMWFACWLMFVLILIVDFWLCSWTQIYSHLYGLGILVYKS